MVHAVPRDNINYHTVSKYVNVLIIKDFYLKTNYASYYLNVYYFSSHNVLPLYLSRMILFCRLLHCGKFAVYVPIGIQSIDNRPFENDFKS